MATYPRGEIATTAKNIDISPYPLYGQGTTGKGFPLYPKDRIAREQGFSRWFDIYWDLLRDPHCWAAMQKRWMAVVLREWEIIPGDDSAAAKQAAKTCKRQIDGLGTNQNPKEMFARAEPYSGFDRLCYGLLKANFYGFSVGEILWDKRGSEIVAKEIKVKSQKRFAIAPRDDTFELRLRTLQNPWQGESLSSKKFVFHVFDDDDGNPFGFGLATRLYYPITYKRRLAQFSLAYADRYGSPTGVGKYPRNDPVLKDEILNLFDAIAQEAGVAIPDSIDLEWLNADGTGSDLYNRLMGYFDNEISKAVLGETGTTDQQTGGGSRARDEVGNEVRIEIAKADADILSDTINKSVLAWITYFNYGDKVAPPKLWRKFPEIEQREADRKQAEESRLDARAGREATIVQFMGIKPTRKYIEETYGIELEEPKPPKPSTGDQLSSIFGGGGEEPAPAEEQPSVEEQAPVEDQSTEEFSEGDRSRIQSILIPSDWDKKEAIAWLKSHDFKIPKIHTTEGYHRVRQYSPNGKKEEYRTIVLDKEKGIKAVVGYSESSEVDEVYSKYRDAINMTYAELRDWAQTKASRKASLDRSPIDRNLELLKTPKNKWTSKHVQWANKTIGFVSRMKEVKDGNPVAIGLGKRSISLLNWAYNPTGRAIALLIEEDKDA